MPPRLDPRRVAAAGLLALVLLLFLDALRPGRSFYFRDIHAYWSMQAESLVRVLTQGSAPLWNPYVTFGVPMLADPSYQVAYPFTWLNLVLGPAGYYRAFAVAHAFFAGVGMCLLLRRLGLGWTASFGGAASWIASGAFLVVLSHTHHFAGTAWTPWVLLALDSALDSVSLRAGALLGAAAAGQVLAGSADLCLMTAFLGLGWALARALGGGVARGAWPRALGCLTAAGAIGAAVSAIQWLPTLAILRSGGRLELSDFARFYWSLHPASLADLWVPRLVAELPLEASVRALLFEGREPLFAVHYLGAAAVPLALMGAIVGREPGRGFAALGLLAALLLSLGRHTPVYALLAHATPLGMLRYPTKYLIAVGFLWAVLVGLGLDAWLSSRVPSGRATVVALVSWAAAAAAGGAGLWLAGRPQPLAALLDPAAPDWALSQGVTRLGSTTALLALAGTLVLVGSRTRWGRLARPGLVVLALLDLLWVGRGVNASAPSELLTRRPQLLRWVPPGSRLWVAQDESLRELELARQPLGWERRWAHVLGRLELAWPPTGARAGLHGSYDGDFTGLAPPQVSDLSLLLTQVAGRPLALRLLQLGGVEYVVTAGVETWPGLVPVASIESVFERPIRVLEVPRPRPRLYAVAAARQASGAEALALLASAGFDPEREVVLDGSPPFGAASVPFDGELREVERRPDRIVADVVTSGGAAVVALEAFYAGWRAELDGREVAVVKANALFNAVVVPPGRHRVVFAYRPRSIGVGAALSLAGLATLAGLALSSLRFRRARVS
jgi:hypothetical protein